MAPKGVKRKRQCRVRPGIDPNDCDENYYWFTAKELANMYGRAHAFLVAGNENVPSRVRECKCTLSLEYGILKKVYATGSQGERHAGICSLEQRLPKDMSGTNDAQMKKSEAVWK